MAQEDLEALLTRMSAIAEAVNAFTSETVQHEAFSALIAAFEGKHHSAKRQPAAAVTEPEQQSTGHPDIGETPAALKTANRVTKTKRVSKESRSGWQLVKDLNLNPVGKQSFNDFIEEKEPKSNQDRYAAVVYYLSVILEISKVNVHQVGTVFRVTSAWREPADLPGALSVTSSRKGTIDSSNFEDIKITPVGRNFVEHELPPKAKSKK